MDHYLVPVRTNTNPESDNKKKRILPQKVKRTAREEKPIKELITLRPD